MCIGVEQVTQQFSKIKNKTTNLAKYSETLQLNKHDTELNSA
jgi:hypothetical protein